VTSEADLLQRAQALDQDALGELYDRYAPMMYAYIYRRVSDAALAEDLTSELFVRVLRAVRNRNAWQQSFTGWLYRIAHNLVVDHYRRQPPAPALSLDETSLPASHGNPVDAVEEAATGERIRAAVHHLTPDQQHVLALRFGEGLKTREISQIMDKTTGAVEALQHRALASLRRILAGETVQ
jgi:RNA polymerase sigma-70 factor (ECF subfamily)